MSISRSKRIIYESDGTDDSSTFDRGLSLHSHKKRILCESDDDMGITESAQKTREIPSSKAVIVGLENVLVGASAAGSDGNSSNDEWDSDAYRNTMKGGISTSRTKEVTSVDCDSTGARRSQRSAAVTARQRLSTISQDAYFSYALPGEDIRSLQSPHILSQKSTQNQRHVSKQARDGTEDEYKGSCTENDSEGDESSDEEACSSREEKLKSSRSTKKKSNSSTLKLRSDSSTRVSSDRSQRLSAAKEVEREIKRREIRRPSARRSALDAMASSEDDEGRRESDGESSQDSNGSVDEVEDQSSVVGFPKGGTSQTKKQKAASRGKTSSFSSSPSRSQSSSKSQSKSQSYNRSSSSGSNAFVRKEMMPEPETYSDCDDEDLDDFIVGSDEEREEQEREREAVIRQREKKQKKKDKEQRQIEKEVGARQKFLARQIEEKEKADMDRVRQLHSQTKSQRRKIIAEDDEDESCHSDRHIQPSLFTATPSFDDSKDEGKRTAIHVRSSNLETLSDKDSVGVTEIGLGVREKEASSCDESSEEEEEEEEEESEEEDDMDGPMLYRRVDALREEEEENDNSTNYIRKV